MGALGETVAEPAPASVQDADLSAAEIIGSKERSPCKSRDRGRKVPCDLPDFPIPPVRQL